MSRFWAYHSEFADHYFSYHFGENIVQELKRFWSANENILDYGCGPGFLIEYLLATGAYVTALDFSEISLKRVDTNCVGRGGFLGAVSPTSLKDGLQFDVITSVEVVEHLSDEHLKDMLRFVRIYLKPNGLLIITTPNDEDLNASTVYCPVSNTLFHRWQHIRTWNQKTLPTWLENEGFQVQEIRAVDFSDRSVRTWWRRVLTRAARAIDKVARDRAHQSKPPHLYCVARLQTEN